MHPSKFRRSGLALLVLVASLLAACASNRQGIVWKHDTWDGTLKIGEASYIVTRETRLFGPYGERIRLQDVPKVSDPDVGVRYLERARVQFTTWEFAGETYLDTLWVLPTE